MKCPACKKTIPENALKCPYCKTRTGLLCKSCNTVNTVFDLKCKNCGKEILKICEHCKSINFPNSKFCRKCGMPFISTKPSVNVNTLEYRPQLISQKNAVTVLTQGLLNDNKKIFSLSGDKGIGKTVVLKETIKKLQEHEFIWLFGKCTPLTQLTPGGLIQDMILNMFSLPNFCINTPDFRKDAAKFFQNEFPEMTGFEINIFINFLYSFQDGKFEDLLINKKKTFNTLFKVFDKIAKLGNFVIVADNFDFIDGFSYEFLNNLLKKENLLPNLNLIMIYSEPKPSKGYFFIEDVNAYLDISIAPLNQKEMNEFCDELEDAFSYTNEEEKQEIIQKSKGHPAFLEQALSLCFDCQISDSPFELPYTFKEVIQIRLQKLKAVNPIAYKTLLGASILGDKINVALIKEIFKFEEKEFYEIIDYLREMRFISPVNEIYYEFKNLLLWETILTSSKNDDDFIELNNKIGNALGKFIMNSNAILGIIAQNLRQPQLALDIWTKNIKLAAYIGDTNLYVISQKQCMALINELDESETLKTRYNISERLGKLLADYNPKEAQEFLPDAIANAKAIGNSPKEIELLGYLSYCCLRTGNYYGNVECVDTVLSKVSPEHKLEIALLKASKLEALLNIGNCGEVINTIDNDIMPVFDEYLTKQYRAKFTYDFVYETWLKTYLLLANALVLQGNDRSFEILTIIFDIIERNQIRENLLVCKAKLTLAFANTMKGDFVTSENILDDILVLYKNNTMDNETILRWNLVKILNNFFRKRYNGLQEDLFQVVTFANNTGDNFTKNILRSLLGKIFKDNDQAKQALEIYNDQITYFAKEKMALGALLTWYLIAEATLDVEGPHAAIEVAEQALDVAQNPKINNYLFVILLKMVIAKACIVISDYETAKIHIENAIILANKFNMKDILSRLYLLYGKYFQEIGLLKTDKQTDYLKGAGKMYERASELIKQTRNNCIHIENEKAKNVLNSFCQLNSISIR
ncbi:MAG: hypothetical protein E7Z93_05690 [Cyanobacteria bacterium SIG32]|nr:hypothetical protein [Cyanobacteria bacterium SIG32]